MIVKNEAETLPKLFASIVPFVDKVVITDTGSTDNTKEVCENLCGDKLKWTTFEWCDDFSAARNFNFSQADTGWVIWADADDVILGGKNIAGIIKNCEESNVNAVMFPYHYVVDEQGNTTVLQTRERLIKNDGTYRWIGKLHEAMLPNNKLARAISLSSVQWIHKTSPTRIEQSKSRNLYMLEKALEEEIVDNKVDARTLYNLGNAYFTDDQFEKAVGCYVKYVPLSGWSEEVYLARHRSALALYHLENYEMAIEAALWAIKDKPEYPDAYIDLGKIYYAQGEYDKALHWLREARTKPYPESLPVVNPLDYTANLSWLIGHCCVQLGRYKDARPHFLDFQKYYPENKDVKDILATIDEGIEEAEIVRAIRKVGSVIQKREYWNLIPKDFLEYPEVLVEKNKFVDKPESTGKDLAIYCGNTIVDWDASSELEGGIGGSEEAVINITRLLAKKGWNVTVYNRPKNAGKNLDGVTFAHFTDFNPKDKWDVFISWRMPSVLNATINAKKKYVWLHDCTPQDMFTPEILNNLDKIIVLSKYHRSLYPEIPEDKFIYSGNGINPEHFAEPVKKNPFYCIYTSAPDRGLECLLGMWPKIKAAVPEAELHWFYGWETFDELHKDNEKMQQYKAKMKSLLNQPGVFEEGRVDHPTIAKKYQEAQLWLYPTQFTEIYCITSDKAQAGGALPVTTNVAALDERVKYGLKFDTSAIYTDEKQQQDYVEKVIHLLTNPAEVEEERRGMTEYALGECTWQRIADQWGNIFSLWNIEF